MLRRGGHVVCLPQENAVDFGNYRAQRQFGANMVGLRNAQAVVAVLDGPQVDEQTAWECGFAYGQGKHVYALRTDTRRSTSLDEPMPFLNALEDYVTTVADLIRKLDEAA